MKLPSISKYKRVGKVRSGRIRPSDCPDGDVHVTLPDGTQTTLPGAAGCCYHYPDCDPCSSPSHYNSLVGQTFPQCGTNNSNHCYISITCNGI